MGRGEVRFRLVLDTKDWQSGWRTAKKEAADAVQELGGKMGAFGKVMQSMGPAGMAAAAAVGGVTLAVGAMAKASFDATMAAAKYGDAMAALEDKTGLSAKSLQALEIAAKLGNSSLDAVASAVNKMQKNLVDGSDAFKKLGLSLSQLRAMAPDQQLKAVAGAIESINDPAQRAAARIAVFGKSGNDLAGTLKAMASGAADLGGALEDKALKASADLQDQMDLLDTAMERVKLQFGAAIAQTPELGEAIKALTQGFVDLSTWVAGHTQEIKTFFGVIFDGAKYAIQGVRDLVSEFKSLPQVQMAGGIASWMAEKLGVSDYISAKYKAAGAGAGVSSGGVQIGRKVNGRFVPDGATFTGGKGPKPKPHYLPSGGLSNAAIAGLLGGVPHQFEPQVERLPMGNLGHGVGSVSNALLSGTPQILQQATKATIDWRSALMDVSNAFATMNNGAARALGSIAGGIATIGTLVKSLRTSVADGGLKGAGGIGGLLGKVGAGLGIAGAAISIGGSIIGGIKHLFGGKSKEEKEAEAAAKKQKIGESISQMTALLDKVKSLTMDKLNAGVSGLAALFKNAAGSAELTQERIDRLGTFGAAMFEELKRQGLSTVEAMKAMGPALDEAIKAAEKGGLTLGGTLGMLADFRSKVVDNEDLVNAADGLSSVVDALRTTGNLTQETFGNVQKELGSVFDDLMAKGFSSNQALALLAPTLLQIRDAARDGKLQVDDATNALINQADQAGLFQNLKDPMQELVEIQKMMLELWAAIAHEQGVTLPDSLRKYIDEINNARSAVGSLPVPGGGGGVVEGPAWHEWTGDGGNAGGLSIPNMPWGPGPRGASSVVVHPGEDVQVTPAGGRHGGVTGGRVSVNLQMDGRNMGRALVELTRKNTGRMRSGMRRNLGLS